MTLNDNYGDSLSQLAAVEEALYDKGLLLASLTVGATVARLTHELTGACSHWYPNGARCFWGGNPGASITWNALSKGYWL